MWDEHKNPFLACCVSFIIGCGGQNLSETTRAEKEFLKRIACSSQNELKSGQLGLAGPRGSGQQELPTRSPPPARPS